MKKGDSGDRIYLPKGIRVIKGYATLILTSDQPSQLRTYSLNVPEELVLKESGILIKASSADSTDVSCDGKSKIIIDADRIKLPLVVRARKSGDFFILPVSAKEKSCRITLWMRRYQEMRGIQYQ